MTKLQAIRYSRGKLEVLDQLRLPHEFHYDTVSTREQAFDCIKSMRVRGAPAIAIVAALALAVELHNGVCTASTAADTVSFIDDALAYLKESRPTAVDLSNAITLLKTTVRSDALSTPADIVAAYIAEAEAILSRDLQTNLSIGDHGADWLLAQFPSTPSSDQLSLLTHCNTGSLATSGHGTALGIIRTLHSRGKLQHAFCTETRPYNQGSRLTAFELQYEKIPATLVTDSMAAALFRTQKEARNIAAVVVGADRVVRNGDTANKIGTYALAVLARHHGIKFIVAAPTTSIDLETETGDGITIEERKPEELTRVTGPKINENRVDLDQVQTVATADQTVNVWNPGFDVTPHDLIDVVVTEKGAISRGEDGTFDFRSILPERWDAAVSK
jgi:methylthioribose-1-phosphate isomerase